MFFVTGNRCRYTALSGILNRRSIFLIAILAGTFDCVPKPAQGSTILVQGNSRFGSGTVTVDPSTGLQWLDLPLTVNLNYFQMEAQLGPGGTFAGFRHATRAEVETLWTSAGIPYFGVGLSGQQMQANYAPVVALENLIGLTRSDDSGFSTGMVSDVNPNSPDMSLRPMIWTPASGWGMAAVNEWASGSSSVNIGHWLVQPIPEPSTASLVGLSLVALGLLRWQSRTSCLRR